MKSVLLRLELAVSLPKDQEQPDLNEDAFALDNESTCAAVSDGASESYDSRRWARLLVDKYTVDHSVSPSWVDIAVLEYARGVTPESLSWSQRAAFERGSFATLLGIHLAKGESHVGILAIGDSMACHFRNGEMLATFPYSAAEDFDTRPALLSTIAARNAFLADSVSGCRTIWPVEPGDAIWLLTDAVAQWLLRERVLTSSSTSVLGAVNNSADFAKLVAEMRNERRMRHDDATAIRLTVLEG